MILAAYVANGMEKVTEEDARRLDLINIAFGTLKDGLLHFTQPVKPEIARLKRANPELRVLLSIGGWGAGGFSTMCSTIVGMAKFVRSCTQAVEEYALDGLDLDWEYPTIDSAGIDASPADRENFTLLLKTLRAALDKKFPGTHKMLTIAAGAGRDYLDGVEIRRIAPLLDYISLMTYDMAGGWTAATHHTALYCSGTNPSSVVSTVERFRAAGVPSEKLVIGAAFYSRRWTNIPDGGTHGLGQKCDDPADRDSGLWGPGFGGILDLLDADGEGRDGWMVGRDDTARARWLYHPGKRELLSYDDEESVAEKAQYALAEGLCGVMYWEHGCDPTRRLLRALSDARQTPDKEETE